jgi:hypothetical protein
LYECSNYYQEDGGSSNFFGYFYNNEYFMGTTVRVIIQKYEFEWGDNDPTPGIDKNCFSF